MSQGDLVSYSQIVQRVGQLCAGRKTGTLFLVSDESQMVQMHLDQGEIVSIVHRNRRELEALAVLVQIRSAKLRFDEGHVAFPERHALATQAVLDHLKKAAAAAPGATVGSGAGANGLTAEIRVAAQKVLVKYVGPMAEIVCTDHFERATDVRGFARSLAEELPDKAQADRFSAEIAAALNLTPA